MSPQLQIWTDTQTIEATSGMLWPPPNINTFDFSLPQILPHFFAVIIFNAMRNYTHGISNIGPELVSEHRKQGHFQWHHHPIWVLVLVLAAPFPIQLLVNGLGKATENGSRSGPTNPRGRSGNSAWLLALAWTSSGSWGNRAVNQR